MISLTQKLPGEISMDIARSARGRRTALGLSQIEASEKSGVSLGSYKRFEREGKISLESLVKIAIAFGCEDQLESLFSFHTYRSIQDVIDANRESSDR